MRKIKCLLGGVALGFILAHFVNSTTGGRKFFGVLNKGAQEFNDAVQSGYRAGVED